MAVDWGSVSVETLSEYTTRAIVHLEQRGENPTPDAIRSTRTKLYQRDIEIAKVVDGMKLKVR